MSGNSNDDDAGITHLIGKGEQDPYRPQRSSSTPRWHRLFFEVGAGIFGHSQDPSHPYTKIGPYDAEGVLGSGSYGCVYKVRDLELDRLMALKICTLESPQAADALMAEARILAQLRHPNIVTVHSTGTHDGDAFFVMGLIEGPSLAKFACESATVPSWEQLVELFCTLGLALAAAHDAGVVHGDFKPANVMLELESMTPYIVDFGLARRVMPGEGGSGGRGTLHYAAPEQLRGEVGDASSDQYSFCVSLWQCLDGGLTPYGGSDSEDLLVDIEAGSPPFDNLSVPTKIRDILRKGMDEEPQRRYPDMRALVHELRLVLGPRVVPAGGPEAPKSPVNSGLIALVVVLAIGLVIQYARARSDVALSESTGGSLRTVPNLGDPGGSEAAAAQADAPLEDAIKSKGCVASSWKPSAAALDVCGSIRQKNGKDADRLWKDHRRQAKPQSADEWVTLIRDTLLIAKTFGSEGYAVQALSWQNSACFDYQRIVLPSEHAKEAEEMLSSAMQAECD